MAGGKQALVVMDSSQNPITQFQSKFTQLQTNFKSWLSNQSLPVEAAVVTATSAFQGAVIGGSLGTLTTDLAPSLPPPPPGSPNFNPQANASLQQAQALTGGPLVQARNFAVMTGVNAGISCVLKRVRGKEDVQSSMIAAFGSGTMFSLVSGVGGPNQVGNAVASGVFFALVQSGIFMIGQKYGKAQTYEDVNYIKTKSMLSNLGLQKYEKNFKRGLLTDNTLPLLSEGALKDASIPPGPRLLILDHLQRDPEFKSRQTGNQKR